MKDDPYIDTEIRLTPTYIVRKVAFIILSPSAIEASHPRLMIQSELFAIIDNDNDNDKQFIFRHVCPYNIKRDIHYVQC